MDCKNPDCDRQTDRRGAHGLCGRCYQRWQKHHDFNIKPRAGRFTSKRPVIAVGTVNRSGYLKTTSEVYAGTQPNGQTRSMVETECLLCGSIKRISVANFHSQHACGCHKIAPGTTLTCQRCGEETERVNSNQKICVPRCSVMKTCPQCEQVFDQGHPMQKFCTITCRRIFNKKKYTCIDCGKQIGRKGVRCVRCSALGRNREPNDVATETQSCDICGTDFISKRYGSIWTTVCDSCKSSVCPECGGPKSRARICLACRVKSLNNSMFTNGATVKWKIARTTLPDHCEANDDRHGGRLDIDHDHDHCDICRTTTIGCGDSIRGRLCHDHNMAEGVYRKFGGAECVSWVKEWLARPYLVIDLG